MILEGIKSRIPLKTTRGFFFFYKRLLVIFFFVVLFWSILIPNLPFRIDLNFPISFSVLAAFLVGSLDLILTIFFYKKTRMSLLLSIIILALSVYAYSPLFQFLYLKISAFLAPITRALSLITIPFVLGKSFHSISGEPKMSRVRSFIHYFITGSLLEIGCLPRFLLVGSSLVISPIMPLFLEFKVYDSVLPSSELELALKKKAVVLKEEDRSFEGYHYYILSTHPFFMARAFGDKTLLTRFKGVAFPLEEQLHMLLFSQKEIRVEYNIFLREIEEDSIKAHDELLVSIKNVSEKTHGVKFAFVLPTTAKDIKIRDYFGEVPYMVETKFAQNQLISVKYREPNYRNQLIVLKGGFWQRVPKRKTDKPVTSATQEIHLETGNLTAFHLKHLLYKIVSKCEIEFLNAFPKPSKFEKKQLIWSFENLKPNERRDIRIKFTVRGHDGKEV